MLELIKFLVHVVLGARWRMGSLIDPNVGLDEIAARQYEEGRQLHRTVEVVAMFKSDNVPIHGTVGRADAGLQIEGLRIDSDRGESGENSASSSTDCSRQHSPYPDL